MCGFADCYSRMFFVNCVNCIFVLCRGLVKCPLQFLQVCRSL